MSVAPTTRPCKARPGPASDGRATATPAPCTHADRAAWLARLAGAAASALLAGSAWAGTLQVLVLDPNGDPVPDVAVVVRPVGGAMPVQARAAAPGSYTINQRHLRFDPVLTVLPPGSRVNFTNDDAYAHHVRGIGQGADFTLRIAAAGHANRPGSTEVVLDQSGPIVLSCHLHASMTGGIYVAETPWFARTDAQGVARVPDVPNGQAQVTLWHPAQWFPQSAVTAQVADGITEARGRLNFVPRRPRAH